VKYFLQTLLDDPSWQEAMDEGLIWVPLAEEWEERAVHSHIVPIKIRGGHEMSLFVHMLLANMNAYPIHYPIVPKGTGLIRCVFHAHNTKEEIDRLVATVGEWALEMLEIERSGEQNTLPSAMRRALALQAAGWKE
jgi:8-amino-7-oxononanoate synthase